MANDEWRPDDGPSTPMSVFAQRDKKNEKAPDYRGDCWLTDTMVQQIANLRNAGMQPRLEFAAWTKETRSGDKYLGGSVRIDVYKMSKSYGKTREEIQSIMDGGEAGAQGAPASTQGLDPSADLFAPSAPAEDDDPFGGTAAPDAGEEDDPFAQ